MFGPDAAADCTARYAIAVICREVLKPAKYGDEAGPLLAAALHWSERTVRYYADVATKWPKAEKFTEAAKKIGKSGVALTWWHFVELAQEPDGRQRTSLMNKARDEGWTVAELRMAHQGDAGETNSGEQHDELPRRLLVAIEDYTSQFTTLKSNEKTFGEDLVDRAGLVCR